NVKVTALDANNNVLAGGTNAYTGKVNLTSSGVLRSEERRAASDGGGVLASQSLTITNTGHFTVTATDSVDNTKAGTSNGFDVTAGALDHFTVTYTTGGDIASQLAGTAFNVKVTALDANNNVLAGGTNAYTGKVNLTSSGVL